MLESLRVRNFQKHIDFTLDLSNPITVLAGKTEAGKTALYRALVFLCLNECDGPADRLIRNWWENKYELIVTLRFDNHIVTRRYGKSNSYKMDKSRYVSFGRGVPEDISKVLNVAPLNFQDQLQLQGPFWISLTGGQVAKELNKVIDLEVIDSSQDKVAKELRDARATEKVTKQRYHEAREKKKTLSWVPECIQEYSSIEVLQSKSSQIALEIAQISQTYQTLIGLDKTRCRLSNSVQTLSAGLAGMELLVERSQKLEKETEVLQSYINNLNYLDSDIEEKTADIEKCKKDMKELAGDTCMLCGQPTVP